MTDFGRLLETLTTHHVNYIIIGGFAATAHGSAFLTVDLDVVYERTPTNVRRLAAAPSKGSFRVRNSGRCSVMCAASWISRR